MKWSKRSRPESDGAKRAPVGVWAYGGSLIVVALIAILGTAGWQLQQMGRQQAAAEARLTARTAELLVTRLEQRLQADNARLRLLAGQPSVIEAFQAHDTAGLQTLMQESLADYPGALRLMAVPARLAEPDLQAQPPIGYALLDLMRKAEQDRQAPAVEVHLPGQPAAHLNLLQPVLDTRGEVLGHVVASYLVTYLHAALSGLDGGGVALQQAGTTVLQLGDTGGPAEQRLLVDGTRWQLVYAAAPPPATAIDSDWLPALVAALLFSLIGVISIGLLRRRIGADAGTLVRVLHDLAEDNLQQHYPVRLAEFAPAATAAFIEARKIEERLPVVPREPAREVVADPPGIEVTELAPAAAPRRPAAARARVAALAMAAGPESESESEPESEPAPQPEPRPEPLTDLEFELPGGGDPAQAIALDRTILRAYDIRGRADAGLSAEVVRALGRAIGSEAAAAGQQEIVVGRDGRLSSPNLGQALIEGLVASGRQVIDIGRVPTPVMNFATFHLGTAAGVMLTGSHNPRDYNGLKIVIGGRTLSGEAIQALGRRVERGDFVAGAGSVRRMDVLPDYVDRIVQDATLHRPLRIVVDCGNGVAGEVAPQVFRAMGCEVEELFCEVDGYFPNHHPDPTVPENLDALVSLVRLQGADLGLAFDGDGDRLGVVDAKGHIIWADRQLMLFARDVLDRHPGGDIVFDVKCSAKLAELVSEHAGVPVMWKSGHSLIKGKLEELDAPLAGEMSGHIFFKDRWYGFDDAIYAGARLLELLSMDSRGSVEQFAELPDAPATPEIRIELSEGEPEAIMAALEGALASDFPQARVTTIDGIRIDLRNGWGLVRASNTQPCLVMRFEADDKASLEEIRTRFRHRLLAVKPDLQLPF